MYPVVTEMFQGSWVRELVTSATPYWSANNPSIAFSPKEGYRCIIRSSNFSLDQSGCTHLINDPEGVIRTQNFLAILDDDLNVVDMDRIDTSAVDGPVNYYWVRGAEDGRLFWNLSKECWQYSGSHRQHRTDGVIAIAVDTLDEFRVTERRIMPSISGGFEKNWMPTGDQNPAFITQCSPATVWDEDIQRFVVFNREMSPETAAFRGSSQALRIPGGYIAVTHEVTWPGRCYWSRFVAFGPQGFLEHYTEPFHLKEGMPQCVLGLTEWNDYYVASFGHRETRALLAFIPKQRVLERLAL